MQAKKGDFASAGVEGLPELVLDGLPRVFPEIRVVDRDLATGEGRYADVAAIDASGRLVLVLAVAGDGDEPLLAALDALSFARRNRVALAEHFRSARLLATLDPLVVLVAHEFSEHLLARLACLDVELVRCFELRTVASARGEAKYLVPIAPSGDLGAAAIPGDTRRFLDAIAPELRALAELSIRRIGRIDDEVVTTAVDRTLSWRLGGVPICCLVAVDGRIQGQVPPRGESRTIAAEADLESLLEEIMARAVDLIGSNAADAAPEEWASKPTENLLTREEIEAFQQP